MRSFIWALFVSGSLAVTSLALADTPPGERGNPTQEKSPQPPPPAPESEPPGKQPAPQPAPQPAQQPAQQPPSPAPASALYAAADELPQIYSLMLQTRRFADHAGHTLAASELASCLPGVSAEQKVQSLVSTLAALVWGNLFVVKLAFDYGIHANPQMTKIAALLVCKAEGRTPTAMVEALEIAYRELLSRNRFLDNLFQIEVAARLMR